MGKKKIIDFFSFSFTIIVRGVFIASAGVLVVVFLWLASPRHHVPFLNFFVSYEAHQWVGGKYVSVSSVSVMRADSKSWRVRLSDFRWLDRTGQRFILIPDVELIFLEEQLKKGNFVPQRVRIIDNQAKIVFSSSSERGEDYVPLDITSILLAQQEFPFDILFEDTTFLIEDSYKKQGWRVVVHQSHIRAGNMMDGARGMARFTVHDWKQDEVFVSLAAQFSLRLEEEGHLVQSSIVSPSLAMRHIHQLWPRAVGHDARIWIKDRITQGSLKQLRSYISVLFAKNGEAHVRGLFGDMKLSQLDMRPRPLLPPVTDMMGTANFDKKHLDIDILQGIVGKHAARTSMVRNARVIFYQLDGHDERARLFIPLSCELWSCLWFLDHAAIGLGTVQDDINQASHALLRLNLYFDMSLLANLLLEDSGLSGQGTITNIMLPALIQGQDVALALAHISMDGKGASIKGDGLLGTTIAHFSSIIPFKTGYNLYEIRGSLKKEDLADWWPNDELSWWQMGSMEYHVLMENRDVPLFSFDITMSQWQDAVLKGRVRGHVWRGLSIEELSLKSDNWQLDGKGAWRSNSSAFLNFDKIRIFNSRGQGAVRSQKDSAHITLIMEDMNMQDIHGISHAIEFLSIDSDSGSNSDSNSEPSSRRDTIINLEVGRIGSRREGAGIIKNLDGRVMLKGGRLQSLEIDADTERLDKKTNVTVSFHQDEHKKRAQLQTQDAGAFLSALDMTHRLQGGNLNLQLHAPKMAKHWQGDILMENFILENSPWFMNILYSVSLGEEDASIAPRYEEESIEGRIPFNFLAVTVEGDDGAIVTLHEGRAETDGFALNFEGQLDYVGDRIALGGSFTPYPALNDLVSQVPVLGQILTGGSNEGLFSVRYGLSGRLFEPDVEVNPLSIVFPGILRYVADGLSLLWGGTGGTELESINER